MTKHMHCNGLDAIRQAGAWRKRWDEIGTLL